MQIYNILANGGLIDHIKSQSNHNNYKQKNICISLFGNVRQQDCGIMPNAHNRLQKSNTTQQ